MTFCGFISKFDTIWKLFCLHVGIENPPTSQNIALPNNTKKMSDFNIGVYWILSPLWGSCWSHVRDQEAPTCAQEPPKSRPRGIQEAPGRRLGARSRPRGAQEAPRPPPGFDFGWFWMLLWTMLATFLNKIWNKYRHPFFIWSVFRSSSDLISR